MKKLEAEIKNVKVSIKALLGFGLFVFLIIVLGILIDSDIEENYHSLIGAVVVSCIPLLLAITQIIRLKKLNILKDKGIVIRNLPFELEKRKINSNLYVIKVKYTGLDGKKHILEDYNRHKITYYYMAETVDLIVNESRPENHYIDIDIDQNLEDMFKDENKYKNQEIVLKEEQQTLIGNQEKINKKIEIFKTKINEIRKQVSENEMKYRKKDFWLRGLFIMIVLLALIYTVKIDVITGIMMLMFTSFMCIGCFLSTNQKRLRKNQLKYINNSLKVNIYKDIFTDYNLEIGNFDEIDMQKNPINLLYGYDHYREWTDYTFYSTTKLDERIEFCECLIKMIENKGLSHRKYQNLFVNSFKRGTFIRIKTNFKQNFKSFVLEDSSKRTNNFNEAYDVFSFDKKDLSEIITTEFIEELMRIRANFKNKINIAVEKEQISVFLEDCIIINEKDIDRKRKFENKAIRDMKVLLETIQLLENI